MNEPPVIGHYMGDVQTDAARFGEVFDPAEGVVIAQATAQTVAQAVAAAKAAFAAFAAWAEQSPLRRAGILFRFKELLDEHHQALAARVTREHGKVPSDAMGEVTRRPRISETVNA